MCIHCCGPSCRQVASLARMDQSSTAWRQMLERAKLPEYARSSSAYIHGFLGLGERVIRLYTALRCCSAWTLPQPTVVFVRTPAGLFWDATIHQCSQSLHRQQL